MSNNLLIQYAACQALLTAAVRHAIATETGKLALDDRAILAYTMLGMCAENGQVGRGDVALVCSAWSSDLGEACSLADWILRVCSTG